MTFGNEQKDGGSRGKQARSNFEGQGWMSGSFVLWFVHLFVLSSQLLQFFGLQFTNPNDPMPSLRDLIPHAGRASSLLCAAQAVNPELPMLWSPQRQQPASRQDVGWCCHPGSPCGHSHCQRRRPAKARKTLARERAQNIKAMSYLCL